MKIDLAKLGEMLLAGVQPKQCMEVFGCSEVAFYKAKKKLPIDVLESIVKVPPTPRPGAVQGKLKKQKERREKRGTALQGSAKKTRFNVSKQLLRINRVNNQILDKLTGEKETTKRMVQAVKAVLDYEKEPTNANLTHLKTTILRISQDYNTAIKASAEIRAQISLLLDIEKQLFNVAQIKKFQDASLRVIGRVAPDVRKDIIKELRESESLRGLPDLT